jgi:hypothetical protein
MQFKPKTKYREGGKKQSGIVDVMVTYLWKILHKGNLSETVLWFCKRKIVCKWKKWNLLKLQGMGGEGIKENGGGGEFNYDIFDKS